MNTKTRPHLRGVTPTVVMVIYFSFFGGPLSLWAQFGVSMKETPATCRMKVNNKDYTLTSNLNGYFMQVSGVKPLTVILIEVTYADGSAGEKVVVTAEEGGRFDNQKQVMAVKLDNEKKCHFNFQVSSQEGIFEVSLYKGDDTKVIRLWVGEEMPAVKE